MRRFCVLRQKLGLNSLAGQGNRIIMKRLGLTRSVTHLGLRLGVAVAILAGSVISMEAAPKPPKPKPPKGTTAAHHALQQQNKKKQAQLLLQQQRKNSARK